MLTATFLFGFVSGTILFLYNNTGGVDLDGEILNKPIGTEITVYEYGGCMKRGVCASYHISDTGTYVYIVRGRNSETIRHEGKLSTGEWRSLYSLLQKENLETVSRSKYSGTCSADIDGISYKYSIVSTDGRYELDSCAQNVSGEFFDTLNVYFTTFGDMHVGVE